MNQSPTSHHDPETTDDFGAPTLLLVSMIGIVGGVAAVVLAAASGTTWAVVAALVIVLVGLVAVSATITRQLAQPGDPVRRPTREP